MKSRLRRAVLLALACASGPVAATATAPAVLAVTPVEATNTAPLVLLPTQVPAQAGEAPATGITAAPELVPPPAPAEATVLSPMPPADANAVTPAKPLRAMTSGEETFARLRSHLSPTACDAGANSARWRQRYAASPAAFSHRLQTVLPLLDFVSLEVERAGLPAEFTFIPLVESWFQPAAMGAGGPAGMWQMIPSTARNHGIHILEGYDGRLSPVESTRAAVSYLKVLQQMFGDWQAIVMAYNAGEGRVQNAMRRAGSRVSSAAQRRPHGLSNITYDYVDKLQALSCLVSQPQQFRLHLPVETRFEPLGPLLIDPGIQSLDAFARTLGKDPSELRRLNPGYRNGRVIAGVPRMVLAPPGVSVEPARVAVAPAPPPALPFDLLAMEDDEGGNAIAELLEVALAAPLADADAFASVDAPETVQPAVALPVADIQPPTTTAFSDPPPPVHEVRKGESLGSIAKHYQLPVEQIRKANGLDQKATLHPGQVLRLVP